jgi:imidazoleglycerol-phosphate dehydratase
MAPGGSTTTRACVFSITCSISWPVTAPSISACRHRATWTSISIEDVGIAFGEAVDRALGTRKGINRAGYFVMPMDETLAVAALDLGGRPHTVVETKVKVRLVGDLQTELVHDFFEGFAMGARANVHLKVMYGRSNHHKIEACFKAFARALRVACARDKRMAKMLPSTKGLL